MQQVLTQKSAMIQSIKIVLRHKIERDLKNSYT